MLLCGTQRMLKDLGVSGPSYLLPRKAHCEAKASCLLAAAGMTAIYWPHCIALCLSSRALAMLCRTALEFDNTAQLLRRCRRCEGSTHGYALHIPRGAYHVNIDGQNF